MTGSPDHLRFRALEVGPGGVPADQVRPVENGPAGDIGAGPGRSVGETDHPATHPIPVGDPGPSAVFGSFDAQETTPSRRAVFGWLALALVVGVVVAVALWSGNSDPTTTSADIQRGDCLASSGGGSVIPVDCSSPDVEFAVASRYDNSTDSAKCAVVGSDLVLITRDEAVLCLNYRATVGECLYAGTAEEVGKAPCRTPGTSSTPTGLFRVVAVLDGTVDARKCPRGTIESLVHVSSREVLCLGLP
jgi:hypothetical protein